MSRASKSWSVTGRCSSCRLTNVLEEEALADAVETEVEGVRMWVLRAEHLVAIALQTGRAKDYARIVQFIEQGAVDTDKLHRVLDRHGLVSRWEKFKRKYLQE